MSDTVEMRTNELSQKILAYANRAGMMAGDKLAEEPLANACGVSRTPIRRALGFLVGRGIVRKDAGVGYVLVETPSTAQARSIKALAPSPVDIRERILRAYAQRRIGPSVTISELARRYDTPRNKVLSALEELAVLNVVEKSSGQSWDFLSDMEAVRSARRSLELRLALEAACMTSPAFRFDLVDLEDVRQSTQDVLSMPMHEIDHGLLTEAEFAFHVFIAHASGNPFIENILRSHLALVEQLTVAVGVNDFKARQSMSDHLQILEHIEAGEIEIAKDRLRVHLNIAHGPREWMHTGTMPAAVLPYAN